jgi:catechol 2,3-dioxygenase-like lactoylglutathione lyase family enzyme
MAVDTPHIVAPPLEAIPVPETSAPLRLGGWDHIGFSVPDLVEAERWYIDVLGAELVGRRGWGGETAHPVPQHVDIRIGSDVLSLFLGDPITGATGVPRHYHYAFTCANLDELEQWQAHLRAKNVKLRNNGAVHGHPGSGAISLYFEDPWGAKLEITTWVQDYATATAEVAKRGGVIMGAPDAGGHRPAR